MSIANQLGDSSQIAANYAAKTGYRNATGQSGSVFEYAISGTYDDWLAEKLATPSLVIELGSYTYRNFSHHKSVMWAMVGA